MRAAPALQVTVSRFGAWRAMVAGLVAASVAALAAWALSPDLGLSWPWRGALAAVGVLVSCLAASLWRLEPVNLRWDTQCWHLGPAGSVHDEPWHGDLAVALDLGAWMLLKFEHDVAGGGRRARWLPVQRLGLERQWHALRCAVYCARPVEGHDPGPGTAIRPESQE